MSTRPTKFIFVTGGVMSSLGKGLASASIGALLVDCVLSLLSSAALGASGSLGRTLLVSLATFIGLSGLAASVERS